MTGENAPRTNGGKHSFDSGSLCLQPGREFQVCPQLPWTLVDRKAGGICVNFEQHVPRFPEIDRSEVVSVEDVRDEETGLLYLLPPLPLFFPCRRPPCDVVDGSCGLTSPGLSVQNVPE